MSYVCGFLVAEKRGADEGACPFSTQKGGNMVQNFAKQKGAERVLVYLLGAVR